MVLDANATLLLPPAVHTAGRPRRARMALRVWQAENVAYTTVSAVHEEDARAFLESVGLLARFDDGTLRCASAIANCARPPWAQSSKPTTRFGSRARGSTAFGN